MKVKEESEKVDIKLNIQKTKIMAPGPSTSWQIYGKTVETVTDYFLGLQNHSSHEMKRWMSLLLCFVNFFIYIVAPSAMKANDIFKTAF